MSPHLNSQPSLHTLKLHMGIRKWQLTETLKLQTEGKEHPSRSVPKKATGWHTHMCGKQLCKQEYYLKLLFLGWTDIKSPQKRESEETVYQQTPNDNRANSQSDSMSLRRLRTHSTRKTEWPCYSNPSELEAIDIYEHLTREILEVPKKPQNKSNSSKLPGT